MQLGAYYAGVAIDNSMLGATHACANPLTRNFGAEHGVAIAVMLPQVVRWNALVVSQDYLDLIRISSQTPNGKEPGESLAHRLEELRRGGGLRESLSSLQISQSDLPTLAEEAAQQWTGTFNPRDWNREGAMEVYQSAL
jgi:alcohol dehydrogenase